MTERFEDIIDLSGIKSLKNLVREIDFLEEEKEKAYQDYLDVEAKYQHLRQENQRLCFALGRHNARQMKLEERLTKARRKYLAR